MKIVIGSDHAGFEHKKKISGLIASLGHEVIDVGTDGENSVDYPDYGEKGAREISCGSAELGVLICSTGIGISMAANKVRGIRAAVCWSVKRLQALRGSIMMQMSYVSEPGSYR